MSLIRHVNAVLAVGLVTSTVQAGAISTAASDFAVWAGGSFDADKKALVHGSVGASSAYLASEAQVQGNLFTHGNVSTGDKARVGGRLVAGGSVSLGKESNIAGNLHAGGSVWLDDKAETGSITGATRVDIDKHAKVTGNVNYNTSSWVHHDATITGSVNQGGASPDQWSGLSVAAPSMSAHGGSTYYASNTTQSLAAGAYGSLSVGKESTLYLSAGTYTFDQLWLDKEVKIEADTSAGDVVLRVVNNLSISKEAQINSSLALMSIIVGGNVWIDKESQVEAGLLAGGNVSISKKTELSGRLYAGGNVWLDKEVEVLANASSMGGVFDAAASIAPVPEPATMAMFVLGGYLFFPARRRHRGGPV